MSRWPSEQVVGCNPTYSDLNSLRDSKTNIALWCNGSTTDFDSARSGSNPGRATQKWKGTQVV